MALSASQLNVGDSYSEQIVDDLTRTQIVQYARRVGRLQPGPHR